VDIDTLADRLRHDVVSRRGSAVLVHHVGAWARKPEDSLLPDPQRRDVRTEP
jgi:hypothetical protein